MSDAAPQRPERGIQVEQLIRRTIDLIDAARPMPLSASSMINKEEVLELLHAALDQLPEEMRAARWLLKEREEFLQKNEEFDHQRAALLTQATVEAKAERERLLDEARKAANALSAKRRESLANDARNLNQAITRRAQDEVFAIARKALTDLATTSLEEQMGEVFTRRLRELDIDTKHGLAEALKTASEPALVRSAFDLPADQRAAIQSALNETFSADIHLRFETAPDLVSGIELTTNGQKVAWSITDYLASLEQGVGELLKAKDEPEDKANPEAALVPKDQ